MRLTGRPAPHLGREAELDTLQSRMESARAGNGGVVLVRGPSGTGTTRFAHEVAARADRDGMVVLWGSCSDGLSGRPFGGLADALEEYARGLEPRTLALQLGEGAAPLARLAPALRAVLPQIPPAAPLDADDERLRLADAVVGWIERASAEQPLLLVLDDVQWAGPDQLLLLEQVARRASNMQLLVLGTQSWSDQPAPGLDIAGAETVELPGLDSTAMGALLSRDAATTLPRGLVEAITDAAAGQPFHARELLRHVLEEGHLGVPGRQPSALPSLPSSLDALVAWRTSRLRAETRLVLHALACLPTGGQASLLAAMARLSRARTADALDEATRAGLVREDTATQVHRLEHDRLRPCLLASISAAQRAQLHRRAADALESDYGDRTREHAAELAQHYHASAGLDGADRGVRHCLLAAEQARAAGAYLRSTQAIEMALDLVPAADRTVKPGLLARLAVARAEAGRGVDALAALTAGLELTARQAAAPADVLAGAVETVAIVQAAELAGPTTTADDSRPADQAGAGSEALRRRAVAAAARADELTRLRLAVLDRSWLPLEIGPIRWLQWSDAGRDAAARLLDQGSQADVALGLATATERTRDRTARVLAVGRTSRRPPTTLLALRCTAFDLLTRHGLFREGAAWADQYLAAAHKYGSLRDQVRAMTLGARAQATLGRLDDARAALDGARSLLGRLEGEADLEREALLSEMVIAHYRDADWAALAERVEQAGRLPVPQGLAFAAERALALARLGEGQAGLELLPSLLEAAAQQLPLAFHRDGALLASLAAAWELGSAEQVPVGRTLVEAARAAGVGTQPTGSLGLAQARLHGLTGDVDAARELFQRERPPLEAAGLEPLRAILDHDEAVCLAAAGPRWYPAADGLLERAARRFEDLGMDGWATRSRQLLQTGLGAASLPGGRLSFRYPAGLTRREADVVRHVAGGEDLKSAARELGLEAEAAERHLEAALEKLGAASAAELPRLARRHGLGGGA